MSCTRQLLREQLTALLGELGLKTFCGTVSKLNIGKTPTAVINLPRQNFIRLGQAPRFYRWVAEVTIEVLSWEDSDVLAELDQLAETIDKRVHTSCALRQLCSDLDLTEITTAVDDSGKRRLGSIRLSYELRGESSVEHRPNYQNPTFKGGHLVDLV